jgi:ribosomal protein S8
LKGLIYGYNIKKNYITIFFKLKQNKFIFTKFLIYSKPSYKITISAIKLKFLIQKNAQAIFFLSNFTGMFTQDFAIKNNIGGILLFKLIL